MKIFKKVFVNGLFISRKLAWQFFNVDGIRWQEFKV